MSKYTTFHCLTNLQIIIFFIYVYLEGTRINFSARISLGYGRHDYLLELEILLFY